MEDKFVLVCVLETKLFQHNGMKTSFLVCDEGSANITTIKASHDCHGAYLVKKDDTEDKYEV